MPSCRKQIKTPPLREGEIFVCKFCSGLEKREEYHTLRGCCCFMFNQDHCSSYLVCLMNVCRPFKWPIQHLLLLRGCHFISVYKSWRLSQPFVAVVAATSSFDCAFVANISLRFIWKLALTTTLHGSLIS